MHITYLDHMICSCPGPTKVCPREGRHCFPSTDRVPMEMLSPPSLMCYREQYTKVYSSFHKAALKKTQMQITMQTKESTEQGKK